ncbi:hypothetical protein ACIKTA_04525 [Hansschlegelia beijingensis]
MGSIKIPYYVVKKGRGYWQPTRRMRLLGFANVCCGVDGHPAWTLASQWNDRWQAARRGISPSPSMIPDNLSTEQSEGLTVYPAGSVGAGFKAFRETPEWSRKKPRTREDWWRAWRRIKPIFGDVDPRTVTLADMSLWRAAIEKAVSLREAHRCLKIWRALWKVLAALQYCEREKDPSLVVRNSAEKGRSETWSEGEVVRLTKAAWRMGYVGLAAAIGVLWDTQMSPVDVRTLTASQKAQDRHGTTFFTQIRGKTEKAVTGVLSPRSARLLDAYLSTLGAEFLPDAPIFRTSGAPPTVKGGRPWTPRPYTKDKMAQDFRAVRSAVFGDAETRMMSDMRRSGAAEAVAGRATAEQLSHAMGNTIATSNALFATYSPPEMTNIREVASARVAGRAKRRDGNE